MDRTFFMLGAASAFLAVAAGAFGAHVLRARLAPDLLAVFETAARYQMYQAIGLLAASYAQRQWGGRAAQTAGWLFVSGTVVFSGSLYLLALTGVRGWGAVAPIGGAAQLGAWLCLFLAAAGGRSPR